MPSARTVSIVTLGCAKNVSDTSNLRRLLKNRGYKVVADPADAGAVVVHTCSFIEAAKKESIDTILAAGQHKTGKKKLIVSGCLVQQHGEELFDELPEVDAFLGTGQLAQIPDLLEKPRPRFIDRANPGGLMDPDAMISDVGIRMSDSKIRNPQSEIRNLSATAYLRLSEGCSHPCTFCVIPRLRGPVQSRSEATILKEVYELAAQGVEEIVIIGQDTGDWGRDAKNGDRLPGLLRSIGAVPGIRWVRLMYMHPTSFTDSLLKVFADDPQKFPYLDMPLQHIDSDMLTAMRRKSDEAGLRTLLEKIKKQAPALALRTTFIVGFPGETDQQFDSLARFVREGFFDYLGAFTYSQEDGTPAARMTDQIPEQIKKDRLAALTDAHFNVGYSKAQKRLGTLETVILEETEGNEVLGRTSREAPDIDAVLRLPRNATRKGRFITAKLTGYDAYEYTAEPVTN